MMSFFRVRWFIGVVILTITLLVMGIGELSRCARTIFGPTTLSFAQATPQGLAGKGYVRITGVRAAMDRCVIVTRTKTRRGVAVEESERWDGAYVPMVDTADADDEAMCVLLASLPNARKPEDLVDVENLEGPNGDEILGFVEGPYESMDSKRQKMIAPNARINTRQCWVVNIRKPSWGKGLGLSLAGLAIPGLFVVWKLKKGFVS